MAPLRLKLERDKNDQEIKLEKEGCEPRSVIVHRKFSAWYVGNVVFGGVIGIVVDAADGAMWRLSPEAVDVTLYCPITPVPVAPPVQKEGPEIPMPKGSEQ
jgi:hypothetical protein